MSADTARDLLALCTDAASVPRGCSRVVGTRRGCGQVGDVLGDWVARADAGDTDVRGFAGFAEGVVTRVEIFPLLGVGREGVRGMCLWRGGRCV